MEDASDIFKQCLYVQQSILSVLYIIFYIFTIDVINMPTFN